MTVSGDGRIRLAYKANNHVPKDRLYHELKEMLGRIGMHEHHLHERHAYLKNDIPVAGCAHQAGTCRFGRDRATSVLDVNCRAHEVDNLYVVDTSCFPSIGAVNPALTAMANALRVGDHLFDRLDATVEAVLALSREENPTVFQKTLGLNDFYFGAPGFEHPLGNIQMVGKSQAPMFRGERPGETRLAPQWTLEKVANHAIDFWLSTEDLPLPGNRVTVDADGRLTLAYTPTNDVPKQRLYGQLKSILGKLDMNADHLIHRFAYMKNEIPVAGVAHQAGTCRFGDDPATSVWNVDCRAHEVDNLYVVDTSVFPSIGAVNPALTAMANSIRVGDHLLARLAA